MLYYRISFKLKILTFLLVVLLITFAFLQSTFAQTCSGEQVVCPNNQTVECSVGTPVCIVGRLFLGSPRCCKGLETGEIALLLENASHYGYADISTVALLNAGFCRTTPQCLSPTYSCNPGYSTCPPNIAPTDPGGQCCLYGCCPSDPTKCKCQFTNECSPNCSPTYSCNPGYAQCPNDPTVPGKCCLYGCCPSDPTKCKCPTNNQCSPNCTVPEATDCNSTYPSCNGVCPNEQTCTATVSGFTLGCSCLSTVSTNPTPTPTTTSCSLLCSNSSACGNGKYCNLTTMCCVLNPSGCFKGCNLNTNDCTSNERCVSNCCVPLIVPESSLVWCTSDLDHNETVCGNQERTLFILNNRNIKRGISLTFMWKNKNLEKSVNCEILSSNKFVTVSPAYTSSSLLDYKKDYAQVVINRRYARILKKTRQTETVTITGSCTDGSEIGNLDIVLTPP